VKIKRVFKGFKYNAENIVEDDNGLNALFKTFTIHQETIANLSGMKGHEMNDLKKIIN
jgi:hypothetical protein